MAITCVGLPRISSSAAASPSPVLESRQSLHAERELISRSPFLRTQVMRCKALFVAMAVCLLSGCTSVAYLNDEVKANPDRSATLIMSTRAGSAYMPTLYYYGMVSEIDGENVFRKADQYKVSPGHHYVTMYCA